MSDDYDRKITRDAIGAFGRYLVSNSYDAAVGHTRAVLSGHAASPRDRALHDRLEGLSADERQAVAEVADHAAVTALHGLLHGLSHDEDRMRLFFDGLDVASVSDGLQGDLSIWLREFSGFPGGAEVH